MSCRNGGPTIFFTTQNAGFPTSWFKCGGDFYTICVQCPISRVSGGDGRRKEREEAVEEEEGLQCLGSDDTTDLTALMAEEEAHAEADEEEEDFDDGIPEDDE